MKVPMAEEPGNYGDYYVLTIEPEPDQPADAAAAAEDQMTLWLNTLAMLVLLAVSVGLAIYMWHLFHVLEPGYSVRFTGVQGLNPSQNPALSPAFNLTVHVNNKQHMRRVCQEESNVIVYYNDGGNSTTRSIGWGKMPAFCVDRWSTTDLDVSFSNQGLFLSQRLREKMEADLVRWQGHRPVLASNVSDADVVQVQHTVCDRKKVHLLQGSSTAASVSPKLFPTHLVVRSRLGPVAP